MAERPQPQEPEKQEKDEATVGAAGEATAANGQTRTGAATNPEPVSARAEAQEAPVPESAERAAAEKKEAGGGEDFARLLDESDATPGRQVKVGDKVSGVLVKIEGENSFVDFGGRGEGVIGTDELKDEKGELAFAVGEPLEAFVAEDGDEVRLTRGLSQDDRHADLLYQAFKAGMPVEGRVDAVNKWGLGVSVQGVRAFCPISQVDTRYIDNAEEYRGQTLQFKIIEFRHQGRDIVLSRRALIEQDQDREQAQVRTQIVKGAELEGEVKRLESFGAFVDIGGGVEGLVHVSEISHQRVGHPEEVLKVGQKIKVQVLRTKNLGNRRKERISLSMKVMEKDPWQEIREQYPSGTVLEGKVDSLEDFGAFVEVAPGVRGLVHVSELADRRVGHPREVVSVGNQVQVVVLEVDARRRRLRLSMKQVESMESQANLREFQARQRKEQQGEGSSSAMLDALKRANLID